MTAASFENHEKITPTRISTSLPELAIFDSISFIQHAFGVDLLILLSLSVQVVNSQGLNMVSTLKTTTHDASLAGFHMADFSSFLSHLTDAVTAAWPDRFTMRYRKVKVLLMSWDRDDLEVEPEARKLESVFRGLYHYDTEYWKIPSRRSAVELSRKVADLVDEHGQEGNLLILYYGGHARPSEQPGGSPVWAAK